MHAISEGHGRATRAPWPRVAIVTGASKGLGFAIAEVLADGGSRLVVNGRDAAALTRAAAALRRPGAEVVAVPGDVGQEPCRRELAAAAAALGGADLLVNNAGTLGEAPLPALREADLPAFRALLEVNLVAPLALYQATFGQLSAGPGLGLVVNVSSDTAVESFAAWGAYGASKAALDHVSRTLALEDGALVSVVSVDPGELATDLLRRGYGGADVSDRPAPVTTAPFWRWLFSAPRAALNGRRFEAQRWRPG